MNDFVIIIRSKVQLEKAMTWEKKYVEFMKEWTSNPENTKHMDVAFNSERSIEVGLTFKAKKMTFYNI